MGWSCRTVAALGPVMGRGALALALGFGCNQADPVLSDESDGGTTEGEGPATSADELLSLERLPLFRLTLDAPARFALEVAPKEWVTGRFEYAGEVYEGVGIRLKGNHSFRPLDEKPSFKLDFSARTFDQRFLGLKGLTLNSMVVDASMLREWVSYRVFRELGVPAPRAGYAQGRGQRRGLRPVPDARALRRRVSRAGV